MAGQGLDAVIIVQNADLFYFTGTTQSGCLYVPAQGQPLYMARKEFRRARMESGLKEIVPFGSMKDIPDILARYGYPEPKRIGMELDVVPVSFFERYKKVYPTAEYLDATPLIRQVRMIKSHYEIHLMKDAADQVHITAPGTDLTFSIKDIPVIPCAGECNIPDGECFTAPVKDSVNGTIQFNTSSRYQGTVFDGIRFELKDGKIINATCSNAPERLNQVLDSDEGARYIGEWSFGTNNRILHPMLDTLFDEKIGGSFHFTPGNAYEEADNGNRSRVHWDLVLIQRADYGGGEISFDGEVIRHDGYFLPADLQSLNEGLPK